MDMFDWRQLKLWNFNESALPGGSIIMNGELNLWDFKYYAIGALAFIMAQTLLIAGLLISRRKRSLTEESLRAEIGGTGSILQRLPGFIVRSECRWYFQRLNPAWESALGYSREELMAKRFLDFVHPDDLERTHGAISTLTSWGKIIHFENRYQCKDGSYRWLEWTSVPAGNLIFAAARDVTERLKAEAEAGSAGMNLPI